MDLAQLSKAHIFKGLSSGELEAIISNIPHRIKKFQAGALIPMSPTIFRLSVDI